MGGLSLPTADAHPPTVEGRGRGRGPSPTGGSPPEHPFLGAAAAGAGGARPGEGKSPRRAGGAASAALLSSPAEGAPWSRPGRRSPRILVDLKHVPQSVHPSRRPRPVWRRSDSEDRAEGLRPARPWAMPGEGVVRWTAALGQGTPPATVALGADLVWGSGVVPIVDGRPVELVDQPMHRARPEAARLCLEVGESANALAVALDADVSILPVAVGRERERA